MNIFLIPTWYPRPGAPSAGIFTKEQILAYAQCFPDDRIAVSLHGCERYWLHPRRWSANFRTIRDYLHSGDESVQLAPNVLEFHRATLEWSARVFDGNIRSLVASHLANLEAARKWGGEVDVIHAHVSYPAGWIAMRLSERIGIPFVITEHMGPFPLPNSAFIQRGRLTRRISEPLKTADRVIAVSESLASSISAFGIARPTVIPNVVDDRVFVPCEATRTGHRKEPTFACLAAITEGKGIGDLLRAFRMVIDRGTAARLLIGGGGGDAPRFHALSRELGLASAVTWVGPVSRTDVPQFLQSADAFVLPSHHESFGVVYAEAMACGLPVIATRCGGPETMINDSNGVLVDVGDPRALAEAINWMCVHLDSFDARKIHEFFKQRYSRAVVSSQVRQVYQDVRKLRQARAGR